METRGVTYGHPWASTVARCATFCRRRKSLTCSSGISRFARCILPRKSTAVSMGPPFQPHLLQDGTPAFQPPLNHAVLSKTFSDPHSCRHRRPYGKRPFDFFEIGGSKAQIRGAHHAGHLLRTPETDNGPRHGRMAQGPSNRHLSCRPPIALADRSERLRQSQVL